jgi:hypothetical protein
MSFQTKRQTCSRNHSVSLTGIGGRRKNQTKAVQSEYELAHSLKKDIVPVRLDDTPLIELLAAYQAIDMRTPSQPVTNLPTEAMMKLLLELRDGPIDASRLRGKAGPIILDGGVLE